MKNIITVILILIIALLATGLQGAESATRPKIGLALSGGGARGLAHIGVLQVLEEVGIEPDYISGTSMGSIIGGLYAIGYRSEQLQDIVSNQNWRYMLMDEILLSDVSYEEKDTIQRYIGQLPVVDFRIKIPSGIVGGHHVSKFLADLTISAQRIDDFDNFNIPFRCVATDIETGDPVVLDSGFLPEAMRISMSIPSAFTPVEKYGKLLIDGGLARNLPVQDLLDMGADIVIAVDVSSRLYTKEELDSFVKIMEQSVNMRGIERSRKQQEMSDILIKPKVSDTGILNFDNCDELIEKGKAAAWQQRARLQKIAEEQNLYQREDRGLPLLKVDNLQINKIRFEGLETVSKNLINGKLNLQEHSTIKFQQISEAIDRLYGSRFFERVTYRLLPAEKGVDLEIRVVEKENHMFNFSFNYNTETKSAVLLNDTVRNFIIDGSRLSFDLRLSELPGTNLSYFIHTGWKPGFGFGLEADFDRYDIDLLVENDFQYYQIDKYLINLFLQTIFVNHSAFGVGTQSEHNELESTDMMAAETFQVELFDSYMFFKINSLNRKYYSQDGVDFFVTLDYYYNIESNVKDQFAEVDFEPFLRAQIKSDKYFPLSKNWTYNLNFEAGAVFGDYYRIPQMYFFTLGGQSRRMQNTIPIHGAKRNFVLNTKFAKAEMALQYNIWKELYLVQSGNIFNTADELEDLLNEENLIFGSSLALGVRTPFGKVEYSIGKNSKNSEVYHFFNVGHRF
jgi:NTE family protein